ncbi:ferredoxin [Nocardioides marmoriginsengisoli]|uniref:Ferredoxin n=1 Tax=Nocardioides marmoriginsengisoli TaxID=661483 RepID=A0A3N0CCV9_9ACTN|nr:ferredoxin [Nocardioides marmoriginsengisoli]
MKVTADLELCQGHQMCQFEAPEVFGLNDAEDKVVLLDETPPEDLRPQVLQAIKYCPAMALSLED